MIDINRVDISESLRAGGKVLYRDEKGCIVSTFAGTFMSDHPDGDVISKAISDAGYDNKLHGLTVKHLPAAMRLKENFSLTRMTPCSQWVYIKEEIPTGDFSNIIPLRYEDVAKAAEIYHFAHGDPSYILERIYNGRIWGIYDNGSLAGFAGFHSEGSLGMLEILPEYRRKGYASILGSFLIGVCMKEGRVPYNHVIDGNLPSLSLQPKLGFVKAELPAIWIG